MDMPIEKRHQGAEFLSSVLPDLAALGTRIQAEMGGDWLVKGDRSPVTVADFAIQAAFARRLAAFEPDAMLVAEERSRELQSGKAGGTWEKVAHYVSTLEPGATLDLVAEWIDRGAAPPGGRFWTLDPIDGTKGYLREEQWVIAAALIEDGDVVLAGLACPVLDSAGRPVQNGSGSLIVASRGEGSWSRALTIDGRGFKRMQVSSRWDPTEARLLASVESKHTNHRQIAAIMERLGSRADMVRMDSQAKYAALAYGKAEMLLRLPTDEHSDYREKIWDQAAGSLIVEEAGGRVTDMHGRPLDFRAGRELIDNQGVIASNSVLHDQILAAVAAQLKDS